MYANHIAFCPLVSHVEYALHALLTLEKKRQLRQTDGRTPDRYIKLSRLPLDSASVIIQNKWSKIFIHFHFDERLYRMSCAVIIED